MPSATRRAAARCRWRSRAGAGRAEAAVAITDAGPGIPAEHHDDVFRRYWTTDPQSSGIGLAIVAEAARDAFGVTLTSPISDSGGTTITLRFPLARPSGSMPGLPEPAN